MKWDFTCYKCKTPLNPHSWFLYNLWNHRKTIVCCQECGEHNEIRLGNSVMPLFLLLDKVEESDGIYLSFLIQDNSEVIDSLKPIRLHNGISGEQMIELLESANEALNKDLRGEEARKSIVKRLYFEIAMEDLVCKKPILSVKQIIDTLSSHIHTPVVFHLPYDRE